MTKNYFGEREKLWNTHEYFLQNFQNICQIIAFSLSRNINQVSQPSRT